MKLQLNILKIKCNRTTAEVGADEIYSAIYFFTGEKIGDDFVPERKSLTVVASDAESGVKKGKVWKPQNNTFVFVLGVKKIFGLNYCLYDKDNGELYDKLRNGDISAVKKAFDISGLTYPKNPANWAEWIIPVVKLLGAVYKYSKQDDRIGAEPFAYHIDDPELSLGKSFTLKRLFANYEVVLNFSLIK